MFSGLSEASYTGLRVVADSGKRAFAAMIKMKKIDLAAIKAAYNGKVPDAMACLGYDVAKILADAIKRAGSTDPEPLKTAINGTKDFPGVSGNITLDADRNATKPAVVLQITGKKYKFVDTVQP